MLISQTCRSFQFLFLLKIIHWNSKLKHRNTPTAARFVNQHFLPVSDVSRETSWVFRLPLDQWGTSSVAEHLISRYTFIHQVERSTVRVKCVVLKNMTQCLVYLTRAQSTVQRGNHEANLPLTNPYIPHRCPQTFFGLSRVPPHETFVGRNAWQAR